MLWFSVMTVVFVICCEAGSSFAVNESISTVTKDQCICVGENVTYQCTVETDGDFYATVWKLNGQVIVVVTLSRIIGDIMLVPDASVKIITNQNGIHTTQLTFVVNSDLEGRSIECVKDTDNVERYIGSQNLTTFKDRNSLEPPVDVKLSKASRDTLVFSWNSTLQDCPTLAFTLEAEDCGVCEVNLDNVTTAICQHFSLSTECSMRIHTVACENVTSRDASRPLLVSIKVPEAPNIIESVAHYSQSNAEITGITTVFNETEKFNVSAGIDGSSFMYSIMYNKTFNNEICHIANISASSCVNGVCCHRFNLSSSQCSPTDVSLSVFGINVFGSGMKSVPIKKAGVNTLVEVRFDPNTNSVWCTYVNQFLSSQISCYGNISYGDTCEEFLGTFNSTRVGQTTSRISLSLESDEFNYCYIVRASNGSLSLIIEGSFVLDNKKMDIGTIVGPVVGIVLILVVSSIIIITLLFIIRYKKSKLVNITTTSSDMKISSDNEEKDLPLSTQHFSTKPSKHTESPDFPIQSEISKESEDNDECSDALGPLEETLIDSNEHNRSHSFTTQIRTTSNTNQSKTFLNDITSTCTVHDVTEDCYVIDFAQIHIKYYKAVSGCGYFEFTTPEYISPDTQIILMDKENRFYTGPGARNIIGLSKGYDDKVEIDPPKLSGTEWQKVFLQTTLYNKLLLKDTKFLHNCEIYEPVEQSAKIFYLKKDYTTADIGKTVFKAYKPQTGLGYFEFTQPEYISPTAKVILMDENENLYTGHGARHIIGACESTYDHSERVHPPNLEGTQWKHVFVQTHIYNKELVKGTKFLYFHKTWQPLNEKKYRVKVFDVHQDYNIVEFAKENIPGYKVDSGHGYYEISKSAYLLPEAEVKVVDMNGSFFTGLVARDILGDGYDFSNAIDVSKFHETNQWKHVFVQTKLLETKLAKGTKFLYCHPTLRKVSTCRVFPVTAPSSDCKIVDFMNEKVRDYKPTEGHGYYQFTKKEHIPPDAEVVLMDIDGHFYSGPAARQIIGADESYDDKFELVPPNLKMTKWQKAFIQSKSYDRILQPDTDFLYINLPSLDQVEEFEVYDITEDTTVVDFTKQNIKNYEVASGYGFYEFIDAEYIEPSKRIMLLDKDGKLQTGAGARGVIGIMEDSDSEINKVHPPELSGTQWKHVFIQSKSYHRKLKQGTKFLYCDSYFDRVDEATSQCEIFTVTADCRVVDFMSKSVSMIYNPVKGQGYYEFIEPEYISPNKQVILVDQDDVLYTGPGTRGFIGAKPGHYDDKVQVTPPSLSGTQWKCVFVQSTSYHRQLKMGTKFLYFKSDLCIV